MFSKVQTAATTLYHMMPVHLDTPKNMLNKCSKLALPIIALLAVNGMPTVSAGPAAYASCMAICLGLTLGGFAPACAIACAPAALAPTP